MFILDKRDVLYMIKRVERLTRFCCIFKSFCLSGALHVLHKHLSKCLGSTTKEKHDAPNRALVFFCIKSLRILPNLCIELYSGSLLLPCWFTPSEVEGLRRIEERENMADEPQPLAQLRPRGERAIHSLQIKIEP